MFRYAAGNQDAGHGFLRPAGSVEPVLTFDDQPAQCFAPSSAVRSRLPLGLQLHQNEQEGAGILRVDPQSAEKRHGFVHGHAPKIRVSTSSWQASR